jgi:hypothetical protein
MATPDSPFAVLTAVAAPALLTNSSTVLVLGLSNRIARVVDRTRTVAGVMASVSEKSELYIRLEHQAEQLRQRVRLLGKAMRLGYAAVGGFAAETLVAVLGGTLVHYELHGAARLAGLAALGIGFVCVAAWFPPVSIWSRKPQWPSITWRKKQRQCNWKWRDIFLNRVRGRFRSWIRSRART